MGQPVIHFEVTGADGDKLRRFYGELFGWRFDVNEGLNYGTVQRETNADGIGIPGGVGEMPPGLPGHLTFYVEVPDVEKAIAEAERLGGKRLTGPTPIPGGPVYGHLTDPEGHMVGVLQSAS